MAKILVADDEPLIALSVADWLEDLGHEPIGPAHDLPTALALAEGDVDAAILDVGLGKETSAAVARRLTERGTPFAVASGYDEQTLDPAYSPGVHLPKPFGPEAFRQVVEELLSRKAG